MFQVGLPLAAPAAAAAGGESGSGGVVKVFIFAELDDYDAIFQVTGNTNSLVLA